MSRKLLLVGSASVHTYNFLKLVKSFFDEIILVTPTETDFTDEKVARKYVVNTSLRHPLRYFGAMRQFRQILRQERPDVIHVQQMVTYDYLLLKANRKTRIPVVSTAWGSDILINPKKGWIYARMVRYCIENSDHLTADAHFIAEEMQKMTHKSLQVTVANFGIDLPETLPEAKENIVYSNRLHNKLYRIDEVIRAFARFAQTASGQGWTLVIGATGSETDALRKLVEELHLQNSVQFVGWVDKAVNQQWYSRAKIWISLPESDATAISLLEAMSNGCIPVVTDLPATREWITDQDNGLLVRDVEHFQLSDALALDYLHLSSYNRTLIEREATKQANSLKFIEIYKSLL